MHSMLSNIFFSSFYKNADFNINTHTHIKDYRFIHLYVAIMHVDHYKAHAIWFLLLYNNII